MQVVEVANIFIWQSKAYLPVLGKTVVGFYWDTDRLLTAELSVESLTVALGEVARIGNPPIRHPTQDEFQKLTPVQRALGTRSWKKMAQAGVICCTVYWAKEKIGVAFSRRDALDIQEIDYAHQKEFPLNVPLRSIVEHILEEVGRRHLAGASSERPDRPVTPQR
jgi:hypothetical protein